MADGPDFDPRQPFTRHEALASGITPWQLRGRDFVRLHRNIYVDRRAPRTLALRAMAALRLAPPGTVASHETAALLWGGSVPSSAPIHVRIPPGETFPVDGVRTHHGSGPLDVRWRRGVPLTSAETTFGDLAESLELVQLVVLGDRLVRRAATSPTRRPGPRRRGLAAREPVANARRPRRSAGAHGEPHPA